ncbi:hypothetical protein [Agromyces humatus]|uniref:Uncharacterized protein n=1 Tax=Agromyces humatus TaxID=279573 RepID=A0ABN2KWG2_9MICO|nr:hypothetical protein [Agromyces humatus]
MSPVERMILLVGGALHAILVWQSVIGLIQVATLLGEAGARYVAGAEEMLAERLWLSALLVIAVPFGWFCMRLAKVTRPWRAELVAVAVTVPLTGVIGVAGAFARYFFRADLTATFIWTVGIVLGIALAGAITFDRIGKRDEKRTSTNAAAHAAEQR